MAYCRSQGTEDHASKAKRHSDGYPTAHRKHQPVRFTDHIDLAPEPGLITTAFHESSDSRPCQRTGGAAELQYQSSCTKVEHVAEWRLAEPKIECGSVSLARPTTYPISAISCAESRKDVPDASGNAASK